MEFASISMVLSTEGADTQHFRVIFPNLESLVEPNK